MEPAPAESPAPRYRPSRSVASTGLLRGLFPRASAALAIAVDVAGRPVIQAGFADPSRRYKLTGIGVETTWSAVAPSG